MVVVDVSEYFRLFFTISQ